MSPPIIVGQHRFSTQAAVRCFVRAILHSSPLGTRLSQIDEEFVLELLKRHPSYSHKAGVGIGHVEVRQNSPYGKPTKGFWIVRLDGSEVDFSYLECIKSSSHESKVKAAMRHEVWPQILYYKELYFGESKTALCEETGTPIQWDRCHVDHRPPKTFDAIAKEFLRRESYTNILCVGVLTGGSHGQIGDRLEDVDLAKRWQEYHSIEADLICVCEKVNLRRKRR